MLINVGSVIGGWNTVGLHFFAFIGAYFVKREDGTLQLHKKKCSEMKCQEKSYLSFDGVAGILQTPGFITDILAFANNARLSPLFAAQVSKHMKMRIVAPVGGGTAGFGQGQSPFGQSPFGDRPNSPNSDGDVFESEYTDHTTNDPDKA